MDDADGTAAAAAPADNGAAAEDDGGGLGGWWQWEELTQPEPGFSLCWLQGSAHISSYA